MGIIGKLLSFSRETRNDVAVSDATVNTGGGINKTVEHYSAPGDDSYPMTGDYAAIISSPGAGRGSAVGYVDPLNDSKAAEGEKRIYARDADGAMVAEVWLKATGEIVLSNDNGSITLSSEGAIAGVNNSGSITLGSSGAISGVNEGGSFELQEAGDFVVNGVTIDTSGNISTAASITASTAISTAALTASTSISTATLTASSGATLGGVEWSEHAHSIAWTDDAGSGVSGGPE